MIRLVNIALTTKHIFIRLVDNLTLKQGHFSHLQPSQAIKIKVNPDDVPKIN